jgi:simple sugar transport system permease protein
MTKKKKNFWNILATNDMAFDAIKILIAILIVLVITFVVLCLVCDTPVDAFVTMLVTPAKSWTFFGRVLKNMVPIVFSGLACALLFRTGLFNMNVEGIYYLGGIICSELAIRQLGNGVVHPIVVVLITGLAGAAMMCVSGFLKAKYNVNELVSSLMLNSIMLYFGLYVLKNTSLRDPAYPNIGSYEFLDTATLPLISKSLGITIGFPLCVLAVIVVHVLLQKTKLGYQIRTSGLNAKFAKYSGMSAFVLFMLVHVLAGFLSGMGTSLELLSNYNRFTWKELSNLGWDGAMMAMLGRNSPIGVLIASFGMSWLTIGATQLQYMGVDKEIISIVKAVLVLLISSQYFLRKWKEKALLKEGTEND